MQQKSKQKNKDQVFDLHLVFEEIIKHSPVFFGVADMAGQIKYMNATGREIFGIENKLDVSSCFLRDYIADFDKDRFQKEVVNQPEYEEVANTTVYVQNKKTTGHIPVELRLFSIDSVNDSEPTYYIAFGHDFRSHVDSEKLLLLFKHVQKCARVGGWELDVLKNEVHWSEQVYNIFQVEEGATAEARNPLLYFQSVAKDELKNLIDNCIDTGCGFDRVFDLIDKKQVHKKIRVTAEAILDSEGNTQRIIGTFHDLTGEFHDKQMIREQSRQLEQLISNNPGMVYQCSVSRDGDLEFSFVSSQGFEIFDISQDEFAQNKGIIFDLVIDDSAEDLRVAIKKSAETLKRFDWKGQICTPKGTLRWVRAKGIPRLMADGSVLLDGILLDITSEVELERKLEEQRIVSLHNAKLATIGELAAGVGHEINNPLAIADGNVSSILKELHREVPSIDKIMISYRKYKLAIRRITKIVSGLRTFARMDHDEEKVFSLNEALEQSVSLIKEFFVREGIQMRYEPGDEAIYVFGHVGRVQQVIMNLFTNARDGLSGCEQKEIRIQLGVTNDKRAYITVSDSGVGVSDLAKEKMFEAFFTTKPIGTGTGIGLAISASIMQEHKGEIVCNEVDKGASFTLFFPIDHTLDAENTPSKWIGIPDNPEARRLKSSDKKLKVLVVDDEEGIRFLLRELLEELNCEVTEACDGQEGLEQLHHHSFDLVLTDIKMPRLDGFGFVASIREENLAPEAFLAVVTGGVSVDYESAEMQGFSKQVDEFLFKPFNEKQIESLVRTVGSRKRAEGKSS